MHGLLFSYVIVGYANQCIQNIKVPVMQHNTDEVEIACIKLHVAFQATCLNKYCVELGIISMADQDDPLDDNKPMNNKSLCSSHSLIIVHRCNDIMKVYHPP